MGSQTRIDTGTLKPLTLLYMGHIGQSKFLTDGWSGLASSLHAEAAPKKSEWVISKETREPTPHGLSVVKNKGYPNGLSPSLSSRGLGLSVLKA